MDADDFIFKWQHNRRSEAAAAKEHFFDLCALLGVPTPNSDPTGQEYAFEKGVKKSTGGAGWADVWKRGCFGWEYKSRGGDLVAAHEQLLQYAGALENPPLLIACDMDRIIVRTNWTNLVTSQQQFNLADLRGPLVRAHLAACWTNPEQWRPATTRRALTERVAAEFAELAKRLRERGHEPQGVAHFVNRLVFCLFADDVGLLPAGLFKKLLAVAKRRPADFPRHAGTLFGAMAEPGGMMGLDDIPWFNGGLFDDASTLPLERDDIALLARVETLDWAEIDPSILGTLFERGLDPDKRSQLGAHYTDAEKIEKLIDPVIRRPLQAEWEATKRAIVATQAAASKRKKANGEAAGTKEFRDFLQRLRAFRVLDPACGSGNFLYLSLLALKDLEHAAMTDAEALGLQREFYGVGPEQVLGIEINPYAAELARVSVWIGDIQWARRHGFLPSQDPVLRKLDTIDCRDAVLAEDGTPAAWPKVDVIVGNPPFLGGKRLRFVLGDETTESLFAAYAGRVPAEADLVCYWFERAREQLAEGAAKRIGLVATNSIRGGANRIVLDRMESAAVLYEAWSDEPWTLDGAAVRVSLICCATHDPGQRPRLDGVEVENIHADLTGAPGLDLTRAKALAENKGVAFMGDTKGGAFDVPGDLARQWLLLPSNPNGRPNSDVLRPWANGMDVARRPSDTWIIDFGWTMSEDEAAYYAAPFSYIAKHVRPVRATNNRAAYAREWWRHVEARQGMNKTLTGLSRFIVTPEVAKHRVFAWMTRPTLPDHKLQVIAREDDATFGILQSRFHELWALAVGSWHGVGNDPRYTVGTCFGTFPFPYGLTPNIPAATYANDPRAQKIAAAARDLVEKRDRWLNPPELVQIVPEVVPGFPDRILPRNEAAAKILKKRTLTNLYNTRGTPEGAWLDSLHRTLDDAVAAAYGWPADLPDDEILARLLALNHARAGAPGPGGAIP
jgi:type II restriction/modification system DNA methylase subunit YeeA